MQGIVKGFSKSKQRIAVQTELGFTVFDRIHGDVSIGDVITGNLNEHGSQDLTNQTTQQTLSVYIEAIQASASVAQSLLSRK